MDELPKYLDSASTTPVDKRVLDAMYPYFSDFFVNASSNNSHGKQAKNAIEKARKHVADLINAESNEIIFTSGATESINLAIKGFVEANLEKGNHIITVKTEHKAVLSTCEYLETRGVEVTYLNVDENGLISLDELKSSIKKSTLLIAIMHVNNETGIIQPINQIGEIAQENNTCFFCDATQAVGKVKVDVKTDNIDLLCFSGHKLNGPKGIGILFKKNNILLNPLIHGGGQENGLRSGTYNTPLIVGLGIASKIALDEFENKVARLTELRNDFEKSIEKEMIGKVCFKESIRAPHISCIILLNQEAERFLITNSKNFIASNGSACNSSLIEVSHVYKEIFNEPKNIIRFSF
jgi:cysteine desulfurase